MASIAHRGRHAQVRTASPGYLSQDASTLQAVIKINGTDYRLVLLDTNALSEFTRPGDSFRSFVSWSSQKPMFVPCFSAFSILEMRRRPDVYERFKKVFQVFPCVLVKSHEQLLDDEVGNYPDPSGIDPILLAFSLLGGDGMDIDLVLNRAFGDESVRGQEQYWIEGREAIVQGISSLVPNFPPEEKAYGRAEVQEFIQSAGFSQIAMRQPEFATRMANVKHQAVDLNAFPSVKATSYAVWHKFYEDRNRRSAVSDAFDIIIASAIPYMDAVITESHLAESLRKTQRIDRFIDHLMILTLRDFRDDPI